MTSNVRQPGSPRVHAIILTQDRPEELSRCVATALTTLTQCDVLTVLDDSKPGNAAANLARSGMAARRSSTAVFHLLADQLHNAVALAHGGFSMAWQAKTAVRDIAPLRNLSLLLAATVAAKTTVLIDDDVTSFDLLGTHSFLAEQPRGPNGTIVGAHIGGSTEMDTVTRLQDALGRLMKRSHAKPTSVAELFAASVDTEVQRTDECAWVSAGYLAFNISPSRFIGFPPGYNEDWLWCLLQHAERGTRIVRNGQLVLHEPRLLRRPTCSDVRFELAGDLILDALVECWQGDSNDGTSTLERLRRHAPSGSILPATRVLEALQRASEVERLGRMDPDLWDYGLRILVEIARSDTLEADGRPLDLEGAPGVVESWWRLLPGCGISRVCSTRRRGHR